MKGRNSKLTFGILGELDALFVPVSPVSDPVTHAALNSMATQPSASRMPRPQSG